MKSKKIEQLIKSGLSRKLVSNLNENQINALYRKLVLEVTMVNASDSSTIDRLKSEKKPFEVYENDELDDENSLGADALQADTGQDMPHDEKDMAPDGMGDDSDNNRKMMGEKEIKEKAVSKQQQKFFGVVKAMKKGEIPIEGKAGEAAKEMSSKDINDFASTPHKGLPKKVFKTENKEGMKMNKPIGKVVSVKKTESKEATGSGASGSYSAPLFGKEKKVNENFKRLIESRIIALIEKHINPKMTKKELLMYLSEAPTAPAAPVKEPTTKPTTKPGTRPKSPNPYKNPNPGTNPAPKANKEELKNKFIDVIMQVLSNGK